MDHDATAMSGAEGLRGFPPQVFLIGAQKAGTTFLAGLLNQHSSICVASPKETKFFTFNHDVGMDWYQRCFGSAEPHQLLIDASPCYAAAPVKRQIGSGWESRYSLVPERISAVSPEAVFIYVVRDPVARLYSEYWHNVRNGSETQPLKMALADNAHYSETSDYHAQLQQYLRVFPRDRIHVLRFEDLTRNPVAETQRCFRFLGLPSGGELVLGSGHNRTFVYPFPTRVLNGMLRPVGGLKRLAKIARAIVPGDWVERAGRLITRDIPPIDPALRQSLIAEFEPMAERFHECTGIRLHPWAAQEYDTK